MIYRSGRRPWPRFPSSQIPTPHELPESPRNPRIAFFMARKWSNKNLAGALHMVNSTVADRRDIFRADLPCRAFIDALSEVRRDSPFKLIAYVLMPDHIHLVVNPPDCKIHELTGRLKSQTSRKIAALFPKGSFGSENKVCHESFKAIPL